MPDDKITTIISMTLICLCTIFASALPGIDLNGELSNIIVPIITGLSGIAVGKNL